MRAVLESFDLERLIDLQDKMAKRTPSMTDIEQRITEILRSHQPWDTLVCDCGWDDDHSPDAWAKHVASVLVTELVSNGR